MLSSLHGVVAHVQVDTVHIVVGGAVGFAVSVPADLARSLRPGDQIDLHTTLIVREDALTLYGFAGREDVVLFTTLLGVTGVGPKSALGILSHLSIEDIARAVADDDDAPFRKVSGIGPKTAKLIVVQLAGRLAPPAAGASRTPTPTGADAVRQQVTTALVGLGWSERVAADAVADVATDDVSVPVLLRLVLAQLGPARAGGARE